MAVEVLNRRSGERLMVELEIGALLWLRNARGEVEQAPRAHLTNDQWQFIEGWRHGAFSATN